MQSDALVENPNLQTLGIQIDNCFRNDNEVFNKLRIQQDSKVRTDFLSPSGGMNDLLMGRSISEQRIVSQDFKKLAMKSLA